MTDNEIKKALESLLDRMRAYEAQQASIGKGLVEDIISMYDRQKAEIERLTVNSNAYALGMKRLSEQLETAKTEAIKEFAERLKEKHRHNTTSIVSLVTVFDNINNLVKEMTESPTKIEHSSLCETESYEVKE